MKITTSTLVAGIALVLFAAVSRADTDGPIAWKTYSQVALPGDGILSCIGLTNTVAGIETDIVQMEKARDIIEHKMESARDLANHSSNARVGNSRNYGEKNKQLFEARAAINASRQVAKDRIDYLKTLLPQCRAATPPAN